MIKSNISVPRGSGNNLGTYCSRAYTQESCGPYLGTSWSRIIFRYPEINVNKFVSSKPSKLLKFYSSQTEIDFLIFF